MRTLKYTNFILTIIAFLLAAIFAHSSGLIPNAYAGPASEKVDVNLQSIGGYQLYGGKIKVEIDNTVEMECKGC